MSRAASSAAPNGYKVTLREDVTKPRDARAVQHSAIASLSELHYTPFTSIAKDNDAPSGSISSGVSPGFLDHHDGSPGNFSCVRAQPPFLHKALRALHDSKDSKVDKFGSLFHTSYTMCCKQVATVLANGFLPLPPHQQTYSTARMR